MADKIKVEPTPIRYWGYGDVGYLWREGKQAGILYRCQAGAILQENNHGQLSLIDMHMLHGSDSYTGVKVQGETQAKIIAAIREAIC